MSAVICLNSFFLRACSYLLVRSDVCDILLVLSLPKLKTTSEIPLTLLLFMTPWDVNVLLCQQVRDCRWCDPQRIEANIYVCPATPLNIQTENSGEVSFFLNQILLENILRA